MRTVVLDADATAWLAETVDGFAALTDAVAGGRLRMLMSVAVKGQVGATPDAATRARRLQLVALAETVAVPAALGSLALDVDYFASDAEAERHDQIRRKGSRSNERKTLGDSVDALMVAAALKHSATLVTLDGSGRRSGLTQRAQAVGCSVMGPAELLEQLAT